MNWFRSAVRSGFQALRPGSSAASQPKREARLEALRQAMLSCLGQPTDNLAAQVQQRIRFSADPDSLWYLRGDLLHVLAAQQGEVLARRQLSQLTPLFDGLLPRAMTQGQKNGREARH
ncbi:hypothetical protein PSQ20_06970 [Curvibacter sp. RS43]|uniref:Uncharacterized protein n=1 Tax=Curvibacter microcysteis TaxID=3026419 RepID=A0ABT5MF87_9BURK|nr:MULTISPECIES: hypothetical protein [unclassified Curvibacter]MDD0810072.1 hypothetical protein [Curvibacter sp. RS43]MDD0815240.1 hypothetical protein [Curvibacter sp. HBC28]